MCSNALWMFIKVAMPFDNVWMQCSQSKKRKICTTYMYSTQLKATIIICPRLPTFLYVLFSYCWLVNLSSQPAKGQTSLRQTESIRKCNSWSVMRVGRKKLLNINLLLHWSGINSLLSLWHASATHIVRERCTKNGKILFFWHPWDFQNMFHRYNV